MAFPSTFLDLQNAVIGKIRLDPNQDSQRVKDWINQAYARVAVETEAFQRTNYDYATADAGSYTLPTDVLRIKEVTVQQSGSTQWGPPLEQTTIDAILNMRQGSGGDNGGVPTYYALSGISRYELFPTPLSSELKVRFYYVYLPTPLVANTDIPLLQEPYSSYLLEYGALSEGADFLTDPKVADYRQLYEVWMRQFRQHLSRKQGGQVRQLAIGGNGGGGWRPSDPGVDQGV